MCSNSIPLKADLIGTQAFNLQFDPNTRMTNNPLQSTDEIQFYSTFALIWGDIFFV